MLTGKKKISQESGSLLRLSLSWLKKILKDLLSSLFRVLPCGSVVREEPGDLSSKLCKSTIIIIVPFPYLFSFCARGFATRMPRLQ